MKIGEITTEQNKLHVLANGLWKTFNALKISLFLCLRSISHPYASTNEHICLPLDKVTTTAIVAYSWLHVLSCT